MKKILLLMLVVCILSSCSHAYETTNSGEVTIEKGTQDIKCEPPNNQYSFNSYKELERALTDTKNENFRSIREGLSEVNSKYSSMVSKFEIGKFKCYVPTLDGDVIGLEEATLFSSELYGMPWLWYNCVVDEERLIVSISYTNLVTDSRLQSAKSYIDVQNIISPNSPSPDNYNRSSYDAVYEKEIRLSDGTVTKALIKKQTGDKRLWVYIYHNGILIKLVADKRLLTDGFFELFELKPADEVSLETKPSQKLPTEVSVG